MIVSASEIFMLRLWMNTLVILNTLICRFNDFYNIKAILHTKCVIYCYSENSNLYVHCFKLCKSFAKFQPLKMKESFIIGSLMLISVTASFSMHIWCQLKEVRWKLWLQTRYAMYRVTYDNLILLPVKSLHKHKNVFEEQNITRIK